MNCNEHIVFFPLSCGRGFDLNLVFLSPPWRRWLPLGQSYHLSKPWQQLLIFKGSFPQNVSLWNLELFIALSFPQVSTGCWRLNANLTIEELHIRFYTAGVKENIFTVFGNSLVDWIDKTVCHQQLKCLKPSEAECKHRRPWWLFGLFSQSIPLDYSLSKWVYNS